MAWQITITQEAQKEFSSFDKDVKEQIAKGILKVSTAPLPHPNGYGKPLGNKRGNNLTGFFKIKYKGIGIRVVYTLILDKEIMKVVVIAKRDDDYCYDAAVKLYKKYGDAIFEVMITDDII